MQLMEATWLGAVKLTNPAMSVLQAMDERKVGVWMANQSDVTDCEGGGFAADAFGWTMLCAEANVDCESCWMASALNFMLDYLKG